MKKTLLYLFAATLAAFGLLTLFLSTSVIFDLFGIRAREGNYVPFVVWANFISSTLYLIASYGSIRGKRWTAMILGIAALVLAGAFIGLKGHISSGGAYEIKTVNAMIFRTVFTLVAATIAYLAITKNKTRIMRNTTISLAVASLFLLGCDSTSHEDSKSGQMTANHEDGHHHHKKETIRLVNGKRWLVDVQMMTHIRNMENDVIGFASAEQRDYKTLGGKLQSNVDLLTSNCTMEGEAHDELHKWLLPYLDLVNGLPEAKDEAEALKKFENIQASFTEFNEYFQ